MSNASKVQASMKRYGPPTKNTPGGVGQIYLDLETGLRYECVESYQELRYKGARTFYNWEERGLDTQWVVSHFNESIGIRGTYWDDDIGNTVPLPYLEFTSPEPFAISFDNPRWDGTIEYSTDTKTWSTWDGSTISGTAVYLRGFDNTVLTGAGGEPGFTIIGANVTCSGNVVALVDYCCINDDTKAPPSMASSCCAYLFKDCDALTRGPHVLFGRLSSSEKCCGHMFENCVNLVETGSIKIYNAAPFVFESMFEGCISLVTIDQLFGQMAYGCAEGCFSFMFANCTSLTKAPSLPDIPLANYCYVNMFRGCTSLTKAPRLPVSELKPSCYRSMFEGCISLVDAPALPATTLAGHCYSAMFRGCISLVNAPALPATEMQQDAYSEMFSGCTSLVDAPALPATTLAVECYYKMFSGCTSLAKIPSLPATTLKEKCYRQMFVRTAVRVSETKTDEYTIAYRIPTSGTGTDTGALNALSVMFDIIVNPVNGISTGTPKINTTYYLHKDNAIVE